MLFARPAAALSPTTGLPMATTATATTEPAALAFAVFPEAAILLSLLSLLSLLPLLPLLSGVALRSLMRRTITPISRLEHLGRLATAILRRCLARLRLGPGFRLGRRGWLEQVALPRGRIHPRFWTRLAFADRSRRGCGRRCRRTDGRRGFSDLAGSRLAGFSLLRLLLPRFFGLLGLGLGGAWATGFLGVAGVGVVGVRSGCHVELFGKDAARESGARRETVSSSREGVGQAIDFGVEELG